MPFIGPKHALLHKKKTSSIMNGVITHHAGHGYNSLSMMQNHPTIVNYTPTLGEELLVDPGFEAEFVDGINVNYTHGFNLTNPAQSADVHSGSKAQQFQGGGQYSEMTQMHSQVQHDWMRASAWVKRVSGSRGDIAPYIWDGVDWLMADRITNPEYSQVNLIYIAKTTNNSAGIHLSERETEGPYDVIVTDDWSFKKLVFSSMLSLVLHDSANVDISAGITLPYPSPSIVPVGLALNWDAEKQNGVLVYFENINNIKVVKYLDGIPTFIATYNPAYVPGARLQAVHFSGGYFITYNGTVLGTVNITDANIINNLYHGWFKGCEEQPFSNPNVIVQVQMVRDEISWSGVEQSLGVYNISFGMIAYIDSLNARGIKPLLVLDYSNTLYASNDRYGPDTPELRTAFGNYVTALVTILAGKVYAYEIWNEPDLALFWSQGPDAVAYADLVDYIAPLIKAADPTTLVVAGAWAMPSPTAVQSLSNVLGSVDAISFHWYCQPYSPTSGINSAALNNIWSTITAIRNLGKQIWITEMGYPTSTDGSGVTETLQATYIRQQLRLSRDMGVDVHLIYDLMDDGSDEGNPEHRFGLFHQDLSNKPIVNFISKE